MVLPGTMKSQLKELKSLPEIRMGRWLIGGAKKRINCVLVILAEGLAIVKAVYRPRQIDGSQLFGRPML